MRIITFLIVLLLCSELQQATAQQFLTQTIQRNRKGDGIENAPICSIRYTSSIAQGEPIQVFVNGQDADGGLIIVEFFLNGESKIRQSLPPYYIVLGPDQYGTLPARLTGTCSDNFGNTTRAEMAVTEKRTINCAFKVKESDEISPVTLNATNISVLQSSNNKYSISFSAKNTEQEDQDTTIQIELESDALKASAKATLSSIDDSEEFLLSGVISYEKGGTQISTLNLTSSDSLASLSCL
jgi:hypothetical protein